MPKKKITAYQVMEAQSKSVLVDNMEVHLAQGWQPCGAVSARHLVMRRGGYKQLFCTIDD